MSGDPATRFRENATEITSLVVTGLWLARAPAFGRRRLAVARRPDRRLRAVVPIVDSLFGDEADPEEDENPEWTVGTEGGDGADRDARDALETLRNRYARGELTDEQFERKLERLLETDTVENADQWAHGRTDDPRSEPDQEIERE